MYAIRSYYECPVAAISIESEKAVVDKDSCIYCSICAQTCPWNAIFVAGKKSPKRDKKIVKFDVDDELCIGCGDCTDKCPRDLIVVKDRITSYNVCYTKLLRKTINRRRKRRTFKNV